MSYVVPGANVQLGVQSVLGGDGINVTGTLALPTINALNKMVSTNTKTVNTVPGTISQIAVMTINVSSTCDLFFSVTLNTTATGLGQNATADLVSGIWLNNFQVGTSYTDGHHGHQGSGSTSNNTFTYNITHPATPPGTYTVSLRASSSITSPAINISHLDLAVYGSL
jgi:hypothetical protein